MKFGNLKISIINYFKKKCTSKITPVYISTYNSDCSDIIYNQQ